jgi:hypothetical protein
MGLLLVCCCGIVSGLKAQGNQAVLFPDMTLLDGIELNVGNVFNYTIDNRSGQSRQVIVSGRVQFRRSSLGFSYRFTTLLQPGINRMQDKATGVTWTYSEAALRELFERYNKLPQGTYEYCVSARFASGDQSTGGDFDACVYNTVDDIFLINLMAPENDAKLHEFNPMLSWTVNYRFASELTYRVRVTELKKGQNNAAAIQRNNPVFQDNHVMVTNTVYPVTARPLEKWQPYVWTVDAFYKGILLGGAEAWKFTIVDDSLLQAVPRDLAYVDIRKENGSFALYAPGVLKLKYELKEMLNDSLRLELQDEQGQPQQMKEQIIRARYGDNRFVLNFYENQPLRHLRTYTLLLHSQAGNSYRIAFKYVNPELIR